MDPFIAEIRIFAGNFAPTRWAKCEGQLLPISQNTALFTLLGTTYGGNGQSTFALPDLLGNAAMHHGQGPGLSDRFLGEAGGAQTTSLLISEIPAHNHIIRTVNAAGDANIPMGLNIARSANGSVFNTATSPQVQLAPQALGTTGGSLPHNNLQPLLTLNFIIALQGVFPGHP